MQKHEKNAYCFIFDGCLLLLFCYLLYSLMTLLSTESVKTYIVNYFIRSILKHAVKQIVNQCIAL